MFLLALIPVAMGSGLAIQTAVNSKLRQYVGSPYLASAVSFTIGALFLIALTVVSGINPLVAWPMFVHNPWWIWLGGLLGVIGLTVNLLLFQRLGSIQTAVLPLFGQIVMGIIIDQFGLFYSPKSGLTVIKTVGILLVTLGMVLATGMLVKHAQPAKQDHQSHVLLQLIGIGSGFLMASQTAINGHLGVVLGSSVHAAMISFTIGTLLLYVLLALLRLPLKALLPAIQAGKHYWWIWLGGFLGALYVFGSAWLVPQIGTGQVVVIALFGQLFFSALIDQFGLFESQANRVAIARIIGLAMMFIGVAAIHFL
ncbi:DMT family transporter [Lactiplantibacillus sp. WILCCON 0030]|uniref:DMT family transporter n=1 Tax=Lactiplantibacillus brownii TaxID=3069269 RepID=A0ABU1AAJ5_9LACO|nr:DMT family transporter [Lactiplantibacillus brownii]MDQ7937974.1 DMT family transporter [Lactiplantibacillus brownii]